MTGPNFYFKKNSESDLDSLPGLRDIENDKINEKLKKYSHALEEIDLADLAEDMAFAIGEGFYLHDKEQYDKALKCFTYVDVKQLGTDKETAFHAAEHYLEALTLKDQIETDYVEEDLEPRDIDPIDLNGVQLYLDDRWKVGEDGDKEEKIDQIQQGKAEIESLEGHFYRRAWLASSSNNWNQETREKIAEDYADKYTEFWRKHKLVSEDTNHLKNVETNKYTEELIESMEAMAKIITGNKDYPDKPTSGKGGSGEMALIHLSGVETLKNQQMKHHKEIMSLYYSLVLDSKI